MLLPLRFPPHLQRWSGIALCCMLLLTACEQSKTVIPDGAFDEQVVDLQGDWKISRVWLNGNEITDRFDFASLTLSLNMDGNGPTNFQIDPGKAPFVVIENGNWAFNDLAFPTQMTFMAGGTEKAVDFVMAPISTGREMRVSFSLGCQDNLYEYEFSKRAN